MADGAPERVADGAGEFVAVAATGVFVGTRVRVAVGTDVVVARLAGVAVAKGIEVAVGAGIRVLVAVGIGGVVGAGAAVAVLVLVAGGAAGMKGVVTSNWSGSLATNVVAVDGGRGVGVLLPSGVAVAVLVAVSVAADPINLGVGIGSAVAVVEAMSVPGVVNSTLKRSVCSNSPAGDTDGLAGSNSSDATVAVGAGIVAWLRSSSSGPDGEPATVTAIQVMIAISVTAPIAAVTVGARVSSVRDSIAGDLHSIAAPAALAIKRQVGRRCRLYAVALPFMLSSWDRRV